MDLSGNARRRPVPAPRYGCRRYRPCRRAPPAGSRRRGRRAFPTRARRDRESGPYPSTAPLARGARDEGTSSSAIYPPYSSASPLVLSLSKDMAACSLRPNLEHHRHRRVARGAAMEEPDAAAAHDQLLDQLDDGAQPGRALRVPPHQRAAVIVHPLDRKAGLAAEDDVCDREGIVRLDRIHLVDADPGGRERAPRRGNRRGGHMGALDPRPAEAAQPHGDRLVARQLARPVAAGDDEPRIAVGGVGLGAVGYRAALAHRLQPAQALRTRVVHTFVACQLADALAETIVRHGEGQRHEALVEGTIIGQRVLVLRIAAYRHLVLFLGGDPALACDILRRLDHGDGGKGIAGEIVEYPILMLAGAAGTARVRVVKMRPVRGAIGGAHDRSLPGVTGDLLGGHLQDARTGRTSLVDGRPAEMRRTHKPRRPGQTIEAAPLRHRHAEDAVIDHRHQDLAARDLLLGDIGREFEAVKMRQRALPASEGRAPVATVRDEGVDQATLLRVHKITGPDADWDRFLGIMYPAAHSRAVRSEHSSYAPMLPTC